MNSVNLSKEEYNKLFEINFFKECPQKIKNVIKINNPRFSNKSILIRNNIDNWHLIDVTSDFVHAYMLSRIETDDYEKFEIKDVTPTYSDDFNDYPIFKTGININTQKRKGNTSFYVNGQKRRFLNEMQLKKWDYFFRANPRRISFEHRNLIGGIEVNANILQDRIKKKGFICFAIIAASLTLLSYFGVFSFLLIGFILFRTELYREFITLYNCLSSNNLMAKGIEKLNDEIQSLETSIKQTHTSDEQILKWLNQEILQIDEDLSSSLRIDKKDLVDLTENLRYRPTFGIGIEEWALVQSAKTKGKKTVNKNHRTHLSGIRIVKGVPVYGVYYLNFLYLTEESINIAGQFYDFILSKQISPFEKEYYYGDILSMGIETDSFQINGDEEAEIETKQIYIAFNNHMERLKISLTDRVAIDSIQDRIRENRLSTGDNYSLNATSSSDTSDELINAMTRLEANNLPSTRANVTINFIKDYWNERKRQSR